MKMPPQNNNVAFDAGHGRNDRRPCPLWYPTAGVCRWTLAQNETRPPQEICPRLATRRTPTRRWAVYNYRRAVLGQNIYCPRGAKHDIG
jgi:hypothetical protein